MKAYRFRLEMGLKDKLLFLLVLLMFVLFIKTPAFIVATSILLVVYILKYLVIIRENYKEVNKK